MINGIRHAGVRPDDNVEHIENIVIDMVSNLIEAFGVQILMLIIFYFFVLVMIFLDLMSGIRKAKKRGEFRTSKGLRRTGDKIAKYFNVLILMTVIDGLQMVFLYFLNDQITFRFPILPVATFAMCVFYGIVEGKSMYENHSVKDKEDFQEAAKLLAKMMADPNGKTLASSIIEYLKTENKKEKNDKITEGHQEQ